MQTLAMSSLTICGIDELAGHSERKVTHVLSVVDPNWPELIAFRTFGAHRRTILEFHDIIDAAPGQVLPVADHVAQILDFGVELHRSSAERQDGHLLVHCHMGVSRSTAAMLTLLAQANPDVEEDRLFERLREIRPQAWPNSLMIGFADDLLKRGGKLNAALGRHYAHQIGRDVRYIDWMTHLGRGRELTMGGHR